MEGENMKKLSIIMPVYNAEKYLTEAIDSILQQKYTNFELIIIDDGSSDDSYAICKRFAEVDSRIHLFQFPNQGSQIARNIGLDKATGEYIAFVDADDMVYPDIYSAQIAAIEESGADLSVCRFTRAKDNDVKLKESARYTCYDDQSEITDVIFGSSEKIYKGGGYLWNKVYTKRILENEKFNEKINMGEDALFNINLIKKIKRLCAIDATLYFYRQNSNGLTKTHIRKYDYWEREIEEYTQLLKGEQEDSKKRRFIEGMLLNCALKGAEAIIYEKLPKENLKRIQGILRQYIQRKHITNQKTKILYSVLSRSVFLFITLRTIANILNK
jgi:glycosyltransferase involved in cell wall biosynthesis